MKMNIKIKLVTFISRWVGSCGYVWNVSSILNLNETRAFSTNGDQTNNLSPAVVYVDADTHKELILEDNRGKAGVYR
jgi:hypothetical protein